MNFKFIYLLLVFALACDLVVPFGIQNELQIFPILLIGLWEERFWLIDKTHLENVSQMAVQGLIWHRLNKPGQLTVLSGELFTVLSGKQA